MSDYCVKISVKSDNHALHNLSSNPTDKVSEFDNKMFGPLFNNLFQPPVIRKSKYSLKFPQKADQKTFNYSILIDYFYGSNLGEVSRHNSRFK